MSPPRITVSRSYIVPVLITATGIGVSTLYFVKDSVQPRMGEPGGFLFGLFNVVGTFTGLTVNVEFSPNIGIGEYWDTVASWSPLSQPLLITPCSESGYYRVNITEFTGGTSLDVWATIANSGSLSLSTTATSVDIFDSEGKEILADGSGNLNVNIVSGGGANASVGANNNPAPTSSTQVASVDSGGKLQAASAANPLPVTASGTVAVSNFPASYPVTNPALAELTFTVAGSPPAECLNVYVANPTSSVVTGTVAVSNFPAVQPVSGTLHEYVPALNATNQVSVMSLAGSPPGPTLIIAANANRQGVLITNPSATATVYIGASGVTTGNGLPLLPNSSITLPVVSAIYGVVISSTQTVGYLEVQ